ncbi:MAG: DUF3800 domain-containing protein [Candidatus Zixiibacteriota bacterium]
MRYYFFIDETGNHDLRTIDPEFPIFLLCGVIISEQALIEMEAKISKIKIEYFKSTAVIFHSREIRRCEGVFQVLFDRKIRDEFIKAMNELLAESHYCLIGSAIRKEDHIKKYGKGASNPYSLATSFMFERMVFYLDKEDPSATVDIVFEKRGKREDRGLSSYVNSLMDSGTYYVGSDRLKQRIADISFLSKNYNIIGLQIADLCAYPLAIHILFPERQNIPFEIIEKKIYYQNPGKYLGWGLKVFP